MLWVDDTDTWGESGHLGEYKSNVCLVTVLLETPKGIIILNWRFPSR